MKRFDLTGGARRLQVTARSLKVLREAGLNSGAADGIRTAKLVRRYGPFAGIVESGAARSPDATAVTDEFGDQRT